MGKNSYTVGELALPYRLKIPVVGGNDLYVCIDWTSDNKLAADCDPFTCTIDPLDIRFYVGPNFNIKKLASISRDTI